MTDENVQKLRWYIKNMMPPPAPPPPNPMQGFDLLETSKEALRFMRDISASKAQHDRAVKALKELGEEA